MNFIEEKALNILENRFNLKITDLIYKRYIDDIILGPFKRDISFFEEIQSVFNSIDDNIKFTLEIPKTKQLNFLDLTIWVENDKILHKNYKKEICSLNSLKKNSWLPNFVKSNYIKQSFTSIQTHCSSSLSNKELNASIADCNHKLRKNGYSVSDINKARYSTSKKDSTQKSKDVSYLKLPFVNDSLIRKINSSIKKYNLDVQLLCTGNKKLRHVFKTKNPVQKHPNCPICPKLPEMYSCEKTGVVYQFSCKSCGSSYIGKTSRPFYSRYREHCNSIKNTTNASALADHTKICANCDTIDDFDIEFLKCMNDPVDLTLTEARLIAQLEPKLNRRHERAGAVRLEVR